MRQGRTEKEEGEVRRSKPNGMYSPLSVTRDLWPWCVWLVCLLTLGWTAATAWDQSAKGAHANFMDLTTAVILIVSPSIPFFMVYSVLIVLVGNFVFGGGPMVVARAVEAYFNERLERRRERLRQEGREQGIELGREEGREEGLEQGIELGREEGREEGLEQGVELGREEARAEFRAWYRRMREAQERNDPFDGPPPGV